jgi:hypothetical protein
MKILHPKSFLLINCSIGKSSSPENAVKQRATKRHEMVFSNSTTARRHTT